MFRMFNTTFIMRLAHDKTIVLQNPCHALPRRHTLLFAALCAYILGAKIRKS